MHLNLCFQGTKKSLDFSLSFGTLVNGMWVKQNAAFRISF